MGLSMTQKIVKDIELKHEPYAIANKFYNLETSHVFKDELDLEYEIKYQISQHFSLPLSSIKVVGSAHIGISPFKNTVFTKVISDLDIAIVDAGQFNYYLNLVLLKTENYSNQLNFHNEEEKTVRNFRYRLSRGIFDFTYLKNIEEIDKFDDFFISLSTKYKDWFKDINARIYLSETCMILKQVDNIKEINNG